MKKEIVYKVLQESVIYTHKANPTNTSKWA